MGILDRFIGKPDPDVVAAERRAYAEELKKVKLEKKNQAMRDAAARGKAKASDGGSIIPSFKKVGKKLLDAGIYLSQTNLVDEPERKQHTSSKKKGKKQKKSKRHDDDNFNGFEIPDFDF